MTMYRLMKIGSMLSSLCYGYILIIFPMETLWKYSPFASLAWLVVICIGLYIELILQEKYPFLRPQ